MESKTCRKLNVSIGFNYNYKKAEGRKVDVDVISRDNNTQNLMKKERAWKWRKGNRTSNGIVVTKAHTKVKLDKERNVTFGSSKGTGKNSPTSLSLADKNFIGTLICLLDIHDLGLNVDSWDQKSCPQKNGVLFHETHLWKQLLIW